jgi:hypothetical protein
MMLACKHQKIFNRWLEIFDLALKYSHYSFCLQPTPASQQLVELLDDSTGVITLYKRKTTTSPSPSKKNVSIMDLKHEVSEEIASPKKSQGLKRTQ